MARRSDEVQAGVDSHVDLILPMWLLLLQHVRLVLIIEELDNRLPRITVVDVVSKSRRIDDGQADWREKVNCEIVPTLTKTQKNKKKANL